MLRQKEELQKRLNERELQKARVVDQPEEKKSVFTGTGKRLSEDRIDPTDVRQARLDFFRKFENKDV